MPLASSATGGLRVSVDPPTVLYLAAGDHSQAVEFEETPEGHALRYGADGASVGMTIVNARRLLDKHGSVRITLPETLSATLGCRSPTAACRSGGSAAAIAPLGPTAQRDTTGA